MNLTVAKNIFDMSEYFRQTDPSRLVHYESIFWNRKYNGTSDMESQMYTRVADIKKFLSEHRDKPFICCEYTHSMGNSNGGMHKYTDLTDEDPLYQGGFIWDFADQQAFGAETSMAMKLCTTVAISAIDLPITTSAVTVSYLLTTAQQLNYKKLNSIIKTSF